MSCAYELRCVSCGRVYAAAVAPEYVCRECGAGRVGGKPLRGVLECVYDYAAWRARHRREEALGEVLWPCTREELARVPLRVGGTPLYEVPRLAASVGVRRVWLKDESVEPTGSLKDRATKLVLAMAIRRGYSDVTCASTGNAACSLAGLCAAAGLRAHIFVPAGAPRAKLTQIAAYGAELIAVDGSYDECYERSLAATREYGWYNRNTAYNPWTIEGKKSVAWEVGLECGGEVPDQVFVPTGDGAIVSGVYKGFYDLVQLGWLERIPRIVAVQAEGSSAIARAIMAGGDGLEARHAGAHSVADS
ncbi:MAG: pyridoxal-phosphate dependent enzyme, partial [bacterium]|nr:pyridoxal-phosphate dependent enzyme [bacterium]